MVETYIQKDLKILTVVCGQNEKVLLFFGECGKTLIFPEGEVPHFCRFCNRDIEHMYMIELNENLYDIKALEDEV